MAKGSLKDIEDNVDAGIDYDNQDNASRQRYVNTQMNYAGGRDNEDDAPDRNAGGHDFQFTPGDPMSKNPIMPGQDNYGQNSPVGAAIAHIASGQASPQEMMMLHQIMSQLPAQYFKGPNIHPQGEIDNGNTDDPGMPVR